MITATASGDTFYGVGFSQASSGRDRSGDPRLLFL